MRIVTVGGLGELCAGVVLVGDRLQQAVLINGDGLRAVRRGDRDGAAMIRDVVNRLGLGGNTIGAVSGGLLCAQTVGGSLHRGPQHCG